MQRWQLFSGFFLAALLTAAIVPTLRSVGPTVPDRIPVPPHTTKRPTQKVAVGPLTLTARLDQQSLVRGVDGERYMVIEVTAPDMPGDSTKSVDLSVVMDVSSSMAGRGKITQSRKAVVELIGQLRETDTFSLVTFSDKARVDIRPTRVTHPNRLIRTVRSINTEGGTNLHDGIQLGLDQMTERNVERVQRVVLLSDGLATVGRTAASDIIRATGARASDGVSVTTIGLGLDFDENLLMSMSDAGGGAYHFVDRPGQLSEMFAAELRKMTQVAGREVALTVDMGPDVEILEVYGYDATTTGDATTIFVGDVHGGERRKVVARVQIPDDDLRTVDVADIDLRYVQALDGKPGLAEASLTARIVEDTRIARGSIDKDVGVLAARAAANSLRARGAMAYADGRRGEARRQMQRSRSLLRSLSSRYGTEDLNDDLEEMTVQAAEFEANSPTSSEGKRAVKKAKEVARERSR
jgi:Ca-activated chloride channel family protein